MGFWIGDQTGMSGDTVSPAPFGGEMPYMGAGGGTPSPAYPVASPGSASMPGGNTLSIPSVVGSPAAPAMPFGYGGGSPSGSFGTPSSTDPLAALLGGSGSGLLSMLLGGGIGSGGLGGILGGGGASSLLGDLFGGGGGIPGGGLLSSLAGSLGGDLGGLIGGNNPSGGMGGNIGGMIGSLGGLALTPFLGPLGPLLGSFGGDFLGTLLGGLIGGGLPKMTKPEGAVSALNSMGGIDTMLGQFIQNQGINKGFDLSEPQGTGFNPAAYGDILQLLSGQSLGENGVGEIPLGNVAGAKKPVTLYGFQSLPGLQGREPNATELTQQQLQQIAPQLSAIAGHWESGGLNKILEQANQLAMKLKAAETY